MTDRQGGPGIGILRSVEYVTPDLLDLTSTCSSPGVGHRLLNPSPREANLYPYVINDPINKVDPTGLICIWYEDQWICSFSNDPQARREGDPNRPKPRQDDEDKPSKGCKTKTSREKPTGFTLCTPLKPNFEFYEGWMCGGGSKSGCKRDDCKDLESEFTNQCQDYNSPGSLWTYQAQCGESYAWTGWVRICHCCRSRG